MNQDLIGKTLVTETDEEYIILGLLSYKSIPCVLAQKVTNDGSVGEKKFFQLTGDTDVSLVSIKNKKIISALKERMETQNLDMPRKIQNGESIQSFCAYLSDFYKMKVVNK